MAGIFATTTHFIGEAMNILNTLLALAPDHHRVFTAGGVQAFGQNFHGHRLCGHGAFGRVFWQAAPAVVAAATVNGMIVALTILYIVFGAQFDAQHASKKAARSTLIRQGFMDVLARPARAGDYRGVAVWLVGGRLFRLRHAFCRGRPALAGAGLSWPWLPVMSISSASNSTPGVIRRGGHAAARGRVVGHQQ